jgi:hypothetical protein
MFIVNTRTSSASGFGTKKSCAVAAYIMMNNSRTSEKSMQAI